MKSGTIALSYTPVLGQSQMERLVQLNPAQTDFRGQTNFICYKQNSVTANIGNKRKLVEGTQN